MRKNRDTKEIFKKIGTLEKIFLIILVLPISIFVLFDLLIYYNILYYPTFNAMDPINAISLLIIFLYSIRILFTLNSSKHSGRRNN